MGRLIKKILTTAVATASVVGTAPGCADNNSSMFVLGVLAPEAPDCTVQADPGRPILGEGVLDVNFSTEYRAWVLVGNQMTPRGRKQQARTETKRVVLTGAEVTLEAADGSGLGSFTVPGTGFVDISRSETPGYGAFLATLIPAETGAGLAGSFGGAYGARQTVIANVRVFGETLGGEEIESAELAFPIQVCNGCSIVYPLDAIDPLSNECSLAGEQATALPCFAGQGAIDCRACSAVNDLCRNVP